MSNRVPRILITHGLPGGNVRITLDGHITHFWHNAETGTVSGPLKGTIVTPAEFDEKVKSLTRATKQGAVAETTTPSAPVHILIEVRDGNFEDIHCDHPFKFQVIDHYEVENGTMHREIDPINTRHLFKGGDLKSVARMNAMIDEANDSIVCDDCDEPRNECTCNDDDDDTDDDDEPCEVAQEEAAKDAMDLLGVAEPDTCETCGRSVPLHWPECPRHPRNAAGAAKGPK